MGFRNLGFTLLELALTIAILLLIGAIAYPSLRFFEKETVLQNTTEQILSAFRLARSKTLASEGSSQYGILFQDAANPDQFTLFKGATFASRDPAFDKVYTISKHVELYDIVLSNKEAAFQRVTGTIAQEGALSLRLVSDPSKTRTIYIAPSGQVQDLPIFSPSDDSRIKDSRHVHIDYTGRAIDTVNDTLTLTFSSATQNISIASVLFGGQIYWEGGVADQGELQWIKIHTHTLNQGAGPTTQFSIHRDRRFNTKPLTISISGLGGNADNATLISYDAAGQTTEGTSQYVSNPQLQ